MSCDIVYGTSFNNFQSLDCAEEIKKYFDDSEDKGTIYLGYPLTASAESKVTIDIMVTSEKIGLLAFVIGNINDDLKSAKEKQDELYYHFDYYLKRYPNLRSGRNLIVSPYVITVSSVNCFDSTEDYLFSSTSDITDLLISLSEKSNFLSSNYSRLCEVVQKISSIKPKKKRINVTGNSKGSQIKRLENEIANMDMWQKKAALEIPEGAQRIRGLAGTGKTVVLALKAAYLHTQHPDWNILITFYTRSLKQQYENLIRKFVSEFSGDEPDFIHLNILHSWGSQFGNGVYYKIASDLNAPVYSYTTAKSKYGSNNTFSCICDELLSFCNKDIEYYDAILIDEAQDMDAPFFKLIYKIAKQPKRIIWAYDELQNLSDIEMPSIEDMFGTNQVVNIENEENKPQRDIILPICYRNPPRTLTIAHALGLGIYNTIRNYPFQAFDNPSVWKDIGYEVVTGKLKEGENVTLRRSENSYPKYFYNILDESDCFKMKDFNSKEEQYAWIAEEIEKNIKEDQLDPDDILVVFPDSYTSMSEYNLFSNYLSVRGIKSLLAGVSNNQDTFTEEGYVTCSGIFRAKGNESPMVYVVNSEYCAYGSEIVKRRNILFTAITRSRAWVRVCGVGDRFRDILQNEFKAIKEEHHYNLAFKCPTVDEMLMIRTLNKEVSDEDRETMKNIKNEASSLIEYIKKNRDTIYDVPELYDLVKLIKKSE